MISFGEILLILVPILIIWISKRALKKTPDAELGEEVLQKLKQQGALLENNISEGYTRLLKSLANSYSERWEKTYAFQVFIEKQSYPNASAVPGGTILITQGMLEFFEKEEITEAEQAALLAHELGHVVLGHSKSLAMRQLDQNYIKVLAKSNPVVKYGQKLMLADRQRDMEFEADEFALKCLYRAGYPIASVGDFLEKTIGFSDFPVWKEFFATHPLTEDRVLRLRKLETMIE